MASSESAKLGDPDNYHVDNGQYIAVLSDDGSKILMYQTHQTRPNYLSIPTLDTDIYSSSDCKNYLPIVCHILGFRKLDIQVVETLTFDEYELNHNGVYVSLTVIEAISCEVPAQHPLTWVDWKHDSTVFHSTRNHPAVSRCLRSFLDNLGSQTQRNMHLPWYCFGYYSKIRSILKDSLDALGYEVSGEPEQVRFSCYSSTYRIPSKPHDVYFKACPGGSNEMFTTQLMCEFFPKDFAPLVGLVPELNGILTLDLGPSLSTLMRNPPDARRRQEYADKDKIMDSVMKYWADFQQRSASCVPKLKSSGLAVCDEAWMKECVEELRTYCRHHKLLSQEDLEWLETCDEIIEEMFSLWKASGIPETVVHGDLSEDNLAQPGGRGSSFVMFDLRTVFVGYPFFDLRDPMWSPLHRRESTYLQCWRGYADVDTISALAVLMRPMEDIITATMRMRDKALWKELVYSEVESNVCSFIGRMKKRL